MINNKNCNCKNGYTPYILNGECRFCYGKNPLYNIKQNYIFYNKNICKILTKNNNIIKSHKLNNS